MKLLTTDELFYPCILKESKVSSTVCYLIEWKMSCDKNVLYTSLNSEILKNISK